MARRIQVTNPDRKIHPYLKMGIAERLVRQLLARWVIYRVSIEMLDLQAQARARSERVAKGYIPEKWPPRELPNTRFMEPQSVQWRIQHRSVQLVAQTF